MPRRGPVQLAVTRDVGLLPGDVGSSALAAAAVKLARLLDGYVEPRDAAAVSRELRATMAELRAIQPATPQGDSIDDLHAKRAARIAARPSAAADPVGS